MKNYLFEVFDSTFGKGIRLFQRSLIKHSPQPTVMDLITQMAFQDSAKYAFENFGEAIPFGNRQDLWRYCCGKLPASSEINGRSFLEFGVWKGESINFFARILPHFELYGFDSFEGLEEDWSGYVFQKGHFSTDGRLPDCEKNVRLIKGWFENTLPSFLNEFSLRGLSIIHMDADTFKPSYFVLDTLSNYLSKGTIIIFDEYFGYTGWRNHEYKAWQEVSKKLGVKYRYIAYTNMQVAVEIL